jgi:hypothetical protein
MFNSSVGVIRLKDSKWKISGGFNTRNATIVIYPFCRKCHSHNSARCKLIFSISFFLPDEDPKTAENREISLYLIFIAEAVILASAVLL